MKGTRKLACKCGLSCGTILRSSNSKHMSKRCAKRTEARSATFANRIGVANSNSWHVVTSGLVEEHRISDEAVLKRAVEFIVERMPE